MRIDADGDQVMHWPIGAVRAGEAVEMAVFDPVSRRDVAMIIPLRSAFRIEDIAGRIVLPGSDRCRIGQR